MTTSPGKAAILACDPQTSVGRLRTFSAALAHAGWRVTVLAGSALAPGQASTVGTIVFDAIDGGRRAGRRRSLQRRATRSLDALKPDLILAMDAPSLALASRLVLRDRASGRAVRLAYDLSTATATGSRAGDDEASAIEHVDAATAGSRVLADTRLWPAGLQGQVATVYPPPLELAASNATAAMLKDSISARRRPVVGVFLAPSGSWRLVRELRRLARDVADGTIEVYVPSSDAFRTRLGLLGARRAHVQPLPDDDDMAQVVQLLDVIVCSSCWTTGLAPRAAAVTAAAHDRSLVASAAVVDELRIGHAVDDATGSAVARAVTTAAPTRLPAPKEADDHAPAARLTYAHQVAQIARTIGGYGEKRIGIGPRNGNGQAWAWAQALRRRGPDLQVDAFAAQYTSGRIAMQHPADFSIPMSDWQHRDWLRWWAHWLRSQYSHLLIEQGLAAAGPLKGSSFVNELPLLLQEDVRVGLVFRGSEIRDPACHAARERWSPFKDPDDPLTQKLQKVSDRSRRALEELDVPSFVTTLDLLDDLPRAVWLPQVLDLDMWSPGDAILQRRRPVVLHAPSNAALKGSEWVDEICTSLHDQGFVEYRRLQEVPYAEMPTWLREADIVIDQLALGSYGVVALQAMACGRLVIGNVSDRVRDRLEEPLPVLQAEPPDLQEVLVEVLGDIARARSLADAGRDYITSFHAGEVSADRLLEHLIGLR